MRPKSMPEFAKKMNDLFRIRNSNAYLDILLMQFTNRLELDILKLDDLLHERHGEYEQDEKSMSDIITQEYGTTANAFVNVMLGSEATR